MEHKQGKQSRGQSAQGPVLYVAFELANSTWKMACSDGSKIRHVTVTAGDLTQVQGAILGAKRHFEMDDEVPLIALKGCSPIWQQYQREVAAFLTMLKEEALPSTSMVTRQSQKVQVRLQMQ